jgi:ribonuclease BN (tRNA processing enzyme)
MTNLDLYFSGVGSALGQGGNTSIVLVPEKTEEKKAVLIDCGFSVLDSIAKLQKIYPQLDIGRFTDVIITHQDADHFSGVGQFMLKHYEWMAKNARNIREINFYSSVDLVGAINKRISEDYSSVVPLMGEVGLTWRSHYANYGTNLYGMDITPIEMKHGTVETCGYKIKYQNFTIVAAWDGTIADKSLLDGTGLLIHDAFYLYGEGNEYHTSAEKILKLAQKHGVPNVALVHISEDEKTKAVSKLFTMARTYGINLMIPKQTDKISIPSNYHSKQILRLEDQI